MMSLISHKSIDILEKIVSSLEEYDEGAQKRQPYFQYKEAEAKKEEIDQILDGHSEPAVNDVI